MTEISDDVVPPGLKPQCIQTDRQTGTPHTSAKRRPRQLLKQRRNEQPEEKDVQGQSRRASGRWPTQTHTHTEPQGVKRSALNGAACRRGEVELVELSRVLDAASKQQLRLDAI